MRSLWEKAKGLLKTTFTRGRSSEPPLASMHPVQAELLKMLMRARQEADGARSRARVIEADMQSVVDDADRTIPLVPFIKPRSVESLMDVWDSAGRLASGVNSGLETFQGDTGGTVSLSSASTTVISAAYVDNGLFSDAGGFNAVWQPYAEFANRPSIKAEVTELLRQHGFDKAQHPAEKSPLELFETAHRAFEGPVTNSDPVSTSLIPLRECIQSVVDGLILRRPVQEEAKSQKAKILSIGRQLGRDRVPAETFDLLADEWHDLNKNVLSEAKRKDVERTEWLSQLNRGTAFLRSLLRGVDSDKFRP